MNATGTACPSCEFTHGTPGKAVAGKDGLMRCECCGSSWRVMGAPSQVRPAAPAPVRLSLAARRARTIDKAQAATGRRRMPAGDGVLWLAGAIAVFSLVAQPFWLLGHWNASAHDGNIEISMLSARQLERDGRISVAVEGRIVNRSGKRQPVGDVDITLSQEEGQAVYSWKHRPAVPYLEPGQSIRFSTANGEVPAAASSVEVRSAGSMSIARL